MADIPDTVPELPAALLMRPELVRSVKDAVLSSYDLPLAEGLKYEHQRFVSCWATEDQVEGMTAFAEKKRPSWKHR